MLSAAPRRYLHPSNSAQHTNKDIVTDLHRIEVGRTTAHPGRRLQNAAGRYHRTFSDADARGRPFLSRARSGRTRRVQVAAQHDVCHDDCAATESDVGGSGNGTTPRYFVAGVLLQVLVMHVTSFGAMRCRASISLF